MKNAKRILITGASGLVGSRLTEVLLSQGYEVAHLSRSKEGSVPTFVWDIRKGTIDKEALRGVDAIVHLAGANVADKRWSESRKKEIIDSRVKSTALLRDLLKQGIHQVKTIVSASAVGYYGFKHPEKVFIESDPPGDDFLAHVTKLWEQSVDEISGLAIRVVKLRIGVVLAKQGGALQAMAKPVRLFAGAPLGSGKQFISWIHLDDLCRMFIHAIENPAITGAVNAVTDTPITNRDLTKIIGKHLNRPVILPGMPAFALKLVLGEMATIVTEGSKVSNEKISKSGYQYKFNNLDDALDEALAS